MFRAETWTGSTVLDTHLRIVHVLCIIELRSMADYQRQHPSWHCLGIHVKTSWRICSGDIWETNACLPLRLTRICICFASSASVLETKTRFTEHRTSLATDVDDRGHFKLEESHPLREILESIRSNIFTGRSANRRLWTKCPDAAPHVPALSAMLILCERYILFQQKYNTSTARVKTRVDKGDKAI